MSSSPLGTLGGVESDRAARGAIEDREVPAAPEDRSDDPVVESIEQSFTRLFVQVKAVLRDAAATIGPDVQPAGWTVLRYVVRNAPTLAGAIAAATGMDKSAVSRQLRDLRERGLVAMEPSPEDARAVVVAPTAEGRSRVKAVTDGWTRRFREILGTWSDEDLRSFAVLLERFADAGPWNTPRD